MSPPRRRATGRKTMPRIRVPLPRQVGGRHEDKTQRPWRRRKHRKQDSDD